MGSDEHDGDGYPCRKQRHRDGRSGAIVTVNHRDGDQGAGCLQEKTAPLHPIDRRSADDNAFSPCFQRILD